MCSTNREPGAWYPPVETAQLGPEESFPERPDLQRRDGHENARMGVPLLCPSPVPGGHTGTSLVLTTSRGGSPVLVPILQTEELRLSHLPKATHRHLNADSLTQSQPVLRPSAVRERSAE